MSIEEWNVVVSVFEEGFREALRALKRFGRVERTPYHNVLVMAVADPLLLLAEVERETETDPALYDAISRVAPAMRCFSFQSREEFEERAKSILFEWLPRLAGRSFHVRLHRRGGRQRLPSVEIERTLDEAVLDALQREGTPGSISFSDPGAVVAIDTVGNRAGMALWTREDLARYKMLRPG